MSPTEQVWDALDPATSHSYVFEEEWDNIPQATITADTDWFSDPHPYLFQQPGQHMHICIPSHMKSIK
jgi:hypothetical protein